MSTTIDDLYSFMKTATLEIKNEIKELKGHLTEEINLLKTKNKELNEKNLELENKLAALERVANKYTLVIYGIEEGETDIYQTVVCQIINEILKINCNNRDFRDVCRIGRKSEQRQRPVRVEVISFSLKTEILQRAKKERDRLKNSSIYISQYYSKEDYNKRKYLAGQLRVAKERNLTAYIKNNTLVIGGEVYTYEQLQKEELFLNDISREDLDEFCNTGKPIPANPINNKSLSSTPREEEVMVSDQQKDGKKRENTGAKPRIVTRAAKTKS